MNIERRNLELKVLDYQRLSFIFTFLSAFLYSGTVIPFEGKTEGKVEILMVSSLVGIILALFTYWRMRVAKNKLNEI
ncbi:YrhC family protein [Terrilactibacillus laevilacticus]|uniref:YrhC family protein n=1 Tax=Terrilactibacillus laevilacticus TaxID=1380157 RepID=A0ABW5PTI4_9BACI|nr:YrhC family protein [Terrilactibacillus laevilacticus]